MKQLLEAVASQSRLRFKSHLCFLRVLTWKAPPPPFILLTDKTVDKNDVHL